MSEKYVPLPCMAMPPRYDGADPAVHYGATPNREAHMAYMLLERWGVYLPDGEGHPDSIEPEVMVARAFEISTLYHAEARRRGWFVEIDLDAWAASRKKSTE